ncbi:MAG TPA: TonB-dependent receptor [Ramlibacter sp.]|nr:TonB-dependent receptor [Ramlibacter sp.]
MHVFLPLVRALRRVLGAAALAGAGAAQAQMLASNLADLSLEQLASIQVMSAGKRAQRLADVSATVFVINADDIRRSGASSLPEVLRLAPNLQVARADANQYAITARGFNSTLTNKMLVLIDGRTVYSPLFSGVFWEIQDVMLEDVERIEVLSGAGGTLYGSNAVNGVINIITRSAADTSGTLVSAGAGNRDRVLSVRHGAETPAGNHWRLYARQTRRQHTELASGAAVRDAAHHTQAGFRTDSSQARDQFTLQGDIYQSRIDQQPAERKLSGLNVLGRWTRDDGGGKRSQLQVYFDRAERDQPGSVRDELDTLDLDFQQLSQPWNGHDLIWGAGYRLQHDSVTNIAPAVLALLPADRRLRLWNVFAQDEIALRGDLKFTLGLKAEHNTYTGIELLPTVRLAWEVAPNHLVWGAASRTVRTPSRLDRELFLPATPPFVIAGGADFQSEVARVYELGYRGQPQPALSYAVSIYHHDFDRLRSIDGRAGGATLNNNFRGQLDGLTAWSQWRLAERWRLNASYVHHRQRFQAVPGSAPLVGAASLGNDPRNRWSLGSSWDLGAHMEFDLQLRRVGALPNPAVPAYAALDARWGWRVRPDLELSVAARNLGDRRHPEWGAAATRAELARSLLLKAEWRL